MKLAGYVRVATAHGSSGGSIGFRLTVPLRGEVRVA